MVLIFGQLFGYGSVARNIKNCCLVRPKNCGNHQTNVRQSQLNCHTHQFRFPSIIIIIIFFIIPILIYQYRQ
jgi:hypothetical protein